MDKYFIHIAIDKALRVSKTDYSEIKFDLNDGTYSITTNEGKYDSYAISFYKEISREDLIITMQSKTLDCLMEQSLNLEERLLENKRRILNLSRMKYDNI